MPKIINIQGQRFGMVAVIDRAGFVGRKAAWRCRCDCGKETVVAGSPLRLGRTRSCGCQGGHGHTKGGVLSPTYGNWRSMRNRCSLPSHPHFADYGGRGITVCERWRAFENFLADMGARPAGKTLDRYPNRDGNYEPSNCRWATMTEQLNNRRSVRILEINGERHSVAEWARRRGYREPPA